MTLDAVLRWNDESTTESQFRIYRSQAVNPTWKADFSQLDTVSADTESYTDTDIPKVQNLTYGVVAVSLAGESDPTISDTLDTTDQTLSASVRDRAVVSASITRSRSLEVSISDSVSVSASLSTFPLVSNFTQAVDDEVDIEFQSADEVEFGNVNNEVEFNNGR